MHHLVFGINFQIRFVSLTSPVSIRLLIHLSSLFVIITRPTLAFLHSFTAGSKSSLPFQQIILTLTDFWYPLDCLHGSLDWTGLMLIGLLFSSFFSFKLTV